MLRNGPEPSTKRSQDHNKSRLRCIQEVPKDHPRRDPPRVFFHLSERNDEATLQAVFTFIDHLLADDQLRDSI
jgi:hypothetical protein